MEEGFNLIFNSRFNCIFVLKLKEPPINIILHGKPFVAKNRILNCTF